jgi:ABC-type Fe3+/spermidine/putrescine transport system ATPase subunit
MAIILDNISKSYSEANAVSHLNLEVDTGEFMSLVGPSGCGKTTTLRMIAGFTTPDTGTVIINGTTMNHVPARERKIGIVFQDYALFPNLTVFENVAFGLRARGESSKLIKDRVAELLDLVQLYGLEARYPKEISGGQKQRVALARALAIQPNLLLLDEPLSALDAKVRLNLRYELRRIQRETNTTAIYVTHDQEEAMSISDHVAVMNDGRIEQIGPPDIVYKQPATPFVADFIGAATKLEVQEIDAERGLVAWNDIELRTIPYNTSGEPRLLIIRPEDMLIEAERGDQIEANSLNRLRGTISGKVFLGATYRYAVDVENERFLVDTSDIRVTSTKYGDTVAVTFDPANTWVL